MDLGFIKLFGNEPANEYRSPFKSASVLDAVKAGRDQFIAYCVELMRQVFDGGAAEM